MMSKVKVKNKLSERYGKVGTAYNATISSEDGQTIEVTFPDGSKEDFSFNEIEFLNDQERISLPLINPKDNALVFVQKGFNEGWEVYQDGVRLKGVKSIDINADIEYMTEHVIKYSTGKTI